MHQNKVENSQSWSKQNNLKRLLNPSSLQEHESNNVEEGLEHLEETFDIQAEHKATRDPQHKGNL